MADDPDDPELELEEGTEPEQEPTEGEGEPQLPPQEPEAEPEQEPEVLPLAAQQQEQVRQPSRRDTRIHTLIEENRRKDGEMSDLRRRLDELTRQVTQPRQQAETPEQRAARFALMTPQEQMTETLREAEQRFGAQVSYLQTQNAEVADKTAFQAKAAVDPLYAKWGPKVEGKLAELRAKGSNAEREVLLKYLIGEAALERRGSKEGRREVAQAAQRVRRATTRPANSGSDTPATRRREDSLERRLENVNI